MFVCGRFRSKLSEMKRMTKFFMNKLKMFNMILNVKWDKNVKEVQKDCQNDCENYT
jgi:hypothetical protein